MSLVNILPKKIIVVNGPDGSGKTTFCQKLQQGIMAKGLSCDRCSIWDGLVSLKGFSGKKDVYQYLATLSPKSRVLFLASAILASMEAKKSAERLIVDSYYYKYLATEIVLGLSATDAIAVKTLFPEPDVHIFLPTKIEECASRKTEFTSYECGFQETTRENFLLFQNQVLPILEELSKGSLFCTEEQAHDLCT